ncbi:hypothetical protein [Paenibacillus durus]|uniref:Uncharacterized protein n=1 Tax=Paenibacillus durus ATCC 35681 TaxID=1333534 RepID=A0A0F7FBJ4_PAEDU|nr:hypothetical protein [Paenibacillus durus]AKG36083.1 hypothetical protein VK70_17225 [Paenibacillus durus ATCC 35681]
MKDQAALGGQTTNRMPSFNTSRFARVTSAKDYNKYGRIEVIFLDYSVPVPVWVVGDIEREPVAGDSVLIGYMDGRKDCPYLVGFVKNESHTTNFVVVKKDKIKLQLPIFGIGEKDSPATKDVAGNLLDNSKQEERVYIEATPDHALISFPTSEDGSTAPATIKVTADGVEINHPQAIKHHSGSKGVVRVGDTVSVDVPGIGKCTGTTTSGSSKTLID